MRLTKTFIAGVAFFAIAAPAAHAVTLVDYNTGTPIGGKFQRWADQAKIPTVRRLRVDISQTDADSFCGTVAGACSSGSQGTGRFTVLAPDADRASFYYELGHQYDWQALTSGERRYLARQWGQPSARWLDSTASVEHHAEDGLEATFPNIYADCASGINDQGVDQEVGFLGSNYSPPAITPRINTCAYLTMVGVKRHESVHGWHRWTWRLASKMAAPTTTIG